MLPGIQQRTMLKVYDPQEQLTVSTTSRERFQHSKKIIKLLQSISLQLNAKITKDPASKWYIYDLVSSQNFWKY